MQFTTALVGCLAAFAIASPIVDIEARAAAVSRAAGVNNNLTVVLNDVKALNTTLNGAPNNGPFTSAQLINILNQSNKLASDINSTTGTANSSTAFTDAESNTLFTKVNGTIKPAVFQLLANFVRHKPGFTSAGLAPTVKSTLQSQRELTRELGNALILKGTAAYKTKSTTLSNQILARFDTTIQAYS